MHSEYTTIAKLLFRNSKMVNDRHSVATTTKAFDLTWDANQVAANEVIE
jgi:hypothetical protein